MNEARPHVYDAVSAKAAWDRTLESLPFDGTSLANRSGHLLRRAPLQDGHRMVGGCTSETFK